MGQVLKIDAFRSVRAATDCRIWLCGIIPLWRRHRWGKWALDVRRYHDAYMAEELGIPLTDTITRVYVRMRDCQRCGMTQLENV